MLTLEYDQRGFTVEARLLVDQRRSFQVCVRGWRARAVLWAMARRDREAAPTSRLAVSGEDVLKLLSMGSLTLLLAIALVGKLRGYSYRSEIDRPGQILFIEFCAPGAYPGGLDG